MKPFEHCPFSQSVHDGLSAIHKKYQNRIVIGTDGNGISIKHYSVNIDDAMRVHHPNAHRWDYGIWIGQTPPHVAFIEAHKAESGEVSVVIEKKEWLKILLTGIHMPKCTWYWIATGQVRIPKNSKYYRQLTKSQIRLHPGRIYL